MNAVILIKTKLIYRLMQSARALSSATAAVVVLQKDGSESAQMARLIDSVLEKGDSQAITDWLDESGALWVVREIQAEVRLERGELRLEEYVINEAGVIVHR